MIGISGDFSQDQYEQVYFCDQNEDCSNSVKMMPLQHSLQT